MFKGIIFALVIFADGQTIGQRFESVAMCESFAQAIAPYVESVECESLANPYGIRGPGSGPGAAQAPA